MYIIYFGFEYVYGSIVRFFSQRAHYQFHASLVARQKTICMHINRYNSVIKTNDKSDLNGYCIGTLTFYGFRKGPSQQVFTYSAFFVHIFKLIQSFCIVTTIIYFLGIVVRFWTENMVGNYTHIYTYNFILCIINI